MKNLILTIVFFMALGFSSDIFAKQSPVNCSNTKEEYQKNCTVNNTELCLKYLGCLQLHNQDTAKKAFKLICDNEQNNYACFSYSMLNFKEDPTGSKKMVEDLCEKKYQPACRNLAKFNGEASAMDSLRDKELFFAGTKAYKEKKIDLAKSILKKSCEKGDKRSCSYLANIFIEEQKFDEATPYLEKSCGPKSLKTCERLGAIYYKDGKTDLAAEKFKQTCTKDMSSGCVGLAGVAYKKGDLPSTLLYYEKACQAGHDCKAIKGLIGQLRAECIKGHKKEVCLKYLKNF